MLYVMKMAHKTIQSTAVKNDRLGNNLETMLDDY